MPGQRHVVDGQSVKGALEFLSNDKLKGRKPGTPEMEAAAGYLEKIFRENGIGPYFETYRDSFNDGSIQTDNIIGCIRGNDPILKNEYVIFGAHYDHKGLSEIPDEAGDIIYNGANDNASGVTAVIEIAKYFADSKANKRSIMFCFFTAEEDGKLGSLHLADKLRQQPGFSLYTMLNFEMIGLPLDDGTVYLTGFKKSNMGEVFNGYAGKTVCKQLERGSVDLFLNMNSDNYPFYAAFNVPSQTVTTFNHENYSFYHNVDDEMENIDTVNVTRIINEMLPVAKAMVNAADKEIILTE